MSEIKIDSTNKSQKALKIAEENPSIEDLARTKFTENYGKSSLSQAKTEAKIDSEEVLQDPPKQTQLKTDFSEAVKQVTDAEEIAKEKQGLLNAVDEEIQNEPDRRAIHHVIAQIVNLYLQHSHDETEVKKEKLKELKKKIKTGSFEIAGKQKGKGKLEFVKLFCTVFVYGTSLGLGLKDKTSEHAIEFGNKLVAGLSDSWTNIRYEAPMTTIGAEKQLNQSDYDSKTQQLANTSIKQQVQEILKEAQQELKKAAMNS